MHVAKSYLDLARAVIDTQVYGKPDLPNNEDVLFALMSCTYIYSYMALTAFCASHLHQLWVQDPSPLREKFKNYKDFEHLMAGPLKELKKALNELSVQLGIGCLHKGRPSTWRELNELLKAYRDYFIHPNPERFHDHVEAAGSLQWVFPSRVASEVISYFFEATNADVPVWVSSGSLKSRGFSLVGI